MAADFSAPNAVIARLAALTSGAQLLPRALVRSIGGMAIVRDWGRKASAFFGGGAAGNGARK
ncbi:MAG TPA: hypothetical protein VKG91_10175 [Roseiarcus sp.]|nr:hypothetical protein [Roseiarcus sp.]